MAKTIAKYRSGPSFLSSSSSSSSSFSSLSFKSHQNSIQPIQPIQRFKPNNHHHPNKLLPQLVNKRTNFSFAGPRKLDEILKMDLIKDKSSTEVSEIWLTYHEEKENVFGSVLSKPMGDDVLKRAKECPFFIQPIFRDGGFFNLISQFQPPSHFFLAYLEDFKMDPNRAQPLITCSIFSDLSDTLGIYLVRCDVINKGLEDAEGYKAAQSILQMYSKDEEYEKVKMFNQSPDDFDFDDYVSCQNQKWKDMDFGTTGISSSDAKATN